MKNKILFITNGRGEDAVAAKIIGMLPKMEIEVFPLVGSGKPFDGLDIKVLGARHDLPGGGFSLRNILGLLKDLPAGMIQTSLSNFNALRKLQNEFSLVVAIGDIVPVIGALLTKTPFIFVGVNKSDYYKWFGYNYTPWEKWALKKWCRQIFSRDEVTNKNLQKQGLPSVYIGNPLMDCVDSSKFVKTKPNTIGFLPGTREDATANMESFLEIINEIKTLAPDLSLQYLTASELPLIPPPLINKPFEETISSSEIVIGLSGTGNEQTAGIGKPLISFPGKGIQYNKKFAKAQKQLLGQALMLLAANPRMVAIQALALMNNPEQRVYMGQIGKERMGQAGACSKIAEYIKTSGF